METNFLRPTFQIRNIRQFIAFRVFFNARFYYPVFTVLFLDFGLTLEQFAILNAVWAATIVIVEVPSGALADMYGRRNLLIAAGIIMVVEISLLCFVPLGNSRLLFAAFFVNRVLSGIAEAAASGADEALAYDTLKSKGDVNDWDLVLEKQMRMQSIAFICAMSLGAAVYDPDLMQRVFDWVGLNVSVTQKMTLRFPLYLTLVMAVLTLLTTIRMTESVHTEEGECLEPKGCLPSILRAFKLTFQAGGWILKTPFALVVIVAGLLFDHVIRMIITLSSQYYRLVHLPEASFGLIGSGLSVLGLFVPGVARRMARRYSPVSNFWIVATLTFSGLLGMTFFIPYAGLIPMVLLVVVMYLIGFFISYYLNQITESSQRATVLSFKGLSLNLAYGIIGILYSLLLMTLRDQASLASAHQNSPVVENVIFINSLAWFPWYFAIITVGMFLFACWRLRDVHAQAP